ncbi:MAG TPA: hypothetical protein VJS13_15220 [Pyrinomonadaceae bacterium]|nr:hypothetical protein [Pyrinomonadaceae bacterium]
MPSVTSWLRLEPRSRDAEMNTSLQARIYDPLWLLARQWQFGEFEGEDNGSPVGARWRGESAPLTRYHSGAIGPKDQITASKYDNARMPLETLVERETVRPIDEQLSQPKKLRLAVEAGQHFLRLLDQQPLPAETRARYRDAFIREFALQPLSAAQHEDLDRDSLAFVDLMTGRVPDGRRLAAALQPTTAGEIPLAPELEIDDGDVAEVEKAARLWLQWSNTLFSEPQPSDDSAWLPERMEYAFSVGARFSNGERVLTAPEYYEGQLDWYAFDANSGVTLGAAADNALKEVTQTAIPAPASFRGMPAARFWEFEDAQVNFGSVDAGPTDMLRLLLVEFALSYGNDWFVIPVELNVGSLYRTNSLVITDSFGVRTALQPSGELPEPFSTWHMFEHAPLRGSASGKPSANLFFLPPSLVKSLESRPIEEVLFLRDEMANMAWGVERIIESASEQQLNRFEQRRNGAEIQPPSLTAKTFYKLATEVPDYWVPLVPVKRSTGLRLERGKLLKLNGREEFVEAQGAILEGGETNRLDIFEEELPREGVRVTRSYQFARWHDGSAHLWIGRRKRVGSGEGSSGLRFDSLFTR